MIQYLPGMCKVLASVLNRILKIIFCGGFTNSSFNHLGAPSLSCTLLLSEGVHGLLYDCQARDDFIPQENVCRDIFWLL